MPHKPSISLDVSDSEIKNLSIGDKFEATVKGQITSLEKGSEFSVSTMEVVSNSSKTKKKGKKEVEIIPPSVRVELTSVKVKQPNEFSALVEDDDPEED